MLLVPCDFALQVNYFGFDDANTMFDGLWGGSDSLAQDWATIVYRIQLLGFNAIRIPFSFKDLQATPKSFSQSCTQVGLGKPSGTAAEDVSSHAGLNDRMALLSTHSSSKWLSWNGWIVS